MNHAEMEVFSWAVLKLAFGIVVRSLLLACVCGMATWLLRSRTAELRFQIWKWMLWALFALPILIQVTPVLSTTSRAMTQMEMSVLPPAPVATVSMTNVSVVSNPTPVEQVNDSFSWLLLIPLFYLSVMGVLLGRLGFNLTRLRRLAGRTEVIRDADLRDISHDVWLKTGAFVTPRVVASEEVSSPVTFDTDDTWILLPPSWRLWSQAKLGAVLAHEMAHVQRNDTDTLFWANVATCIFWFHPLAWFLRNELAVLAEEACDEAVIAEESTPEQYARYLIDFARDVNRNDGRFAGAIAVAGNSPMKRRIERLFVDATHMQKGRRLITAMALALFIPALYVSAAAKPGQAEFPKQDHVVWPSVQPTEESVAKFEQAIADNPDDVDSRMALLVYASMKGQEEAFKTHLLWFINHHPTVTTLSLVQSMHFTGSVISDTSRLEITSAWESAIADNPGSPDVLSNAASFIEEVDPERALGLLEQAKSLSNQRRYDDAIAEIYAAAEAEPLRSQLKMYYFPLSPDAAQRLRERLAASRDPQLLADTGETLVNRSHRDSQFDLGIALIKRAIDLDPSNKKWSEFLERAQTEPQRQAAVKQLNDTLQNQSQQRTAAAGAVRIGAKVAEANLLTKVDPVYPPLAAQARISGVVEFTAIIGTDGKIENLQLVRGHPLMVNAAKDAVLQYVYKPTLMNGQAVKVVTQIIVPFNLTH